MHAAVSGIAAVLSDAVAVSEALLSGDIVEARFRTALLASHAAVAGWGDVQSVAAWVSGLLDTPQPLQSEYAKAALALSVAVEHALAAALA